jgi:acetylornithine deacetylase/succinyl-diaminopimelate desuccinylase-like protein
MGAKGERADQKRIRSFLAGEKKRFEDRLGRLVRIPTVSMDPARRKDIRRGADLAVRFLRQAGAEARIVQTPGNPVVIGTFRSHPRHPTVTVYNHLDVQPADEPQWRHPPFDFRIRGDRYHGRGATDDKGPALTAMLAARYAAENGIPLNIRFVWEFEEEIGSPNFEGFLKRNRMRLTTDSVLVSDTIWLAKNRPAVPYGLRGMVAARLILETASKDAHSGLTGGAARNPISELCGVIAACVDAETGRVRIPGFYRDVLSVGRSERRGFATAGFSVPRFRKAHGLSVLRTNNAAELMRRIWIEPTFEVHGITGGYRGPGVKTAIPHRAEAKISMRLVPGQDPAKILALATRHIRKLNGRIRVVPEGFLSPFLGPSSGPYAEAAREAIRFGFGRNPAFIREGGSIGAVIGMKNWLRAPIVFMGLSLPEHGYHAPNEYFDWGQASGGVLAFVRYFERIASL